MNETRRLAFGGRHGGRGVIPAGLGWLVLGLGVVLGADRPAAVAFKTEIKPILDKYCADCHADGAKKGGVAFDEFKTDADLVGRTELWSAVLKNLRAGLMPPHKKPQPETAEVQRLVNWVKYDAFALDPQNPDPGRVTVRRLNRVEYRNTIRDLMGTDFNTEVEFPADDTGHGFDDIGDVLTISPMLLEKYLGAAKVIVAKTVPLVPKVMPEKVIPGREFQRADPPGTNAPAKGGKDPNSLTFSYYQAGRATNLWRAPVAGKYQLVLDFTANETFVDNQFDLNQCRLTFSVDGQEVHRRDFVREGGRAFHFEFLRELSVGPHELALAVEPLAPEAKQIRALRLRMDSVTVRGPQEEAYWVRPKDYAKYFPKDTPTEAGAKRAYARELLGAFATKAWRRPVEAGVTDRLAGLAESVYRQPGKTFEAGVAHAMTAVLAAPRFLFREEANLTPAPGRSTAPVDEYALATRLAYFLWSSMPDEELRRDAAAGTLRKHLGAQVKRMLGDWKAEALVRNFGGQWLQVRDIETVQIDERSVLSREDSNGTNRNRGGGFGFRKPRAELDFELRDSMRRETESCLKHIIQEDRAVGELLESDYTYLNERLAKHYGLTNLNVTGSEMRLVKLPADSPRGGLLTQGAVLAVTSNPTRTSPVKRGVFILDNILGTPALPPPPDVPPLEDAGKGFKDRTPTLRETLELHRAKPVCASCHSAMDPLGLALESFNAMGMFREQEYGQKIDASGELITGEAFTEIRQLKHILATRHRGDFYRVLTEKLLTYALGRGLEYYDVQTVDQIVAQMERENGRFSVLLQGIIDSAPFQQRRVAAGEQHAELKTQSQP